MYKLKSRQFPNSKKNLKPKKIYLYKFTSSLTIKYLQ